MTFSGEDLRKLFQPCVYYLKQGQAMLYIGVGTKGAVRPFGRSFAMPDRLRAQQECDSMELVFFETADEALRHETQEIHKHHPKYNRGCALCHLYDLSMKKGSAVIHRPSVSLQCKILLRALDRIDTATWSLRCLPGEIRVDNHQGWQVKLPPGLPISGWQSREAIKACLEEIQGQSFREMDNLATKGGI